LTFDIRYVIINHRVKKGKEKMKVTNKMVSKEGYEIIHIEKYDGILLNDGTVVFIVDDYQCITLDRTFCASDIYLDKEYLIEQLQDFMLQCFGSSIAKMLKKIKITVEEED